MYITFILFFISLAGIMLMVGRKLAPVRNGQIFAQEYPHPFVPHIENLKRFSYKSLRKYEHIALVATLRMYVRFSNYTKYSYSVLVAKIKTAINKDRFDGDTADKREISKFLKIISDYKKRVRNIKHRIKEEEMK
ncbi:MAG: hypothetical protein KBC06_00745 [Candidatus Pacebacteria bacterium]|nr:hypothetical protein [Candidatus Paceibacterota bacterium]